MTVRSEILCCRIDSVDAASLARCKQLLNADEMQRLNAFRAEAAANEFVIGRSLLRTTLAARLQCAPTALQFTLNADGKPQLSGVATDSQFNISHSRDWVVLALSRGAAVGVDVEAHRRRNNLVGIARRFFSSQEFALLSNQPEAAWLDYFFAVWTLKEAHAKALGTGLAKILSCSSMEIDLQTKAIQLRLDGIARCATDISSWLYRLDTETSLALVEHGCSVGAPQLSICTPFSTPQLLLLEPIAQGRWSPV